MKRRGRRGGEMRKGIIVGGMILGLLLGCNNGIAELEKKSTFYESVMKIGQGFQEIFGIFGNTMGDVLGVSAVKFDDNREKLGDHFEKVKKGLEDTKNKLEGLSGKISETKNADGSAVKVVEESIKKANEFFDQLISAFDKLVSVAKEAGATALGAASGSGAAVGGNDKDVNAVIQSVNAIIKVANKSGIEIKPGVAGSQVINADGPKVLAGNAKVSAGDPAKLAAEVFKADPWAMIDKIKDATAKTSVSGDADVGALASGAGAASITAKSNADLAAAVALKAMTKTGTFAQLDTTDSAAEAAAANGAAASAVNKVLGVLDEIIRRTVAKNLEKVREAVKGINYSDIPGVTEATEVKK